MDTLANPSTITSNSSVGGGVLSTLGWLVWRLGSMTAGLGAVVATLLYFKQESMLYFPEIGGIPRRPGSNPRRYRSPSEHQIPFETHRITCEDGVEIHSWLLLRSRNTNINNSKDGIPTLVFFHGNAGNIGLRLPNALQMYQYLNVNILMVEYRGYGDSDSVTPNEYGLKLDSEAALRFIMNHPNIDNTKIFLFGRSLGGAVAFHLTQYAEQQTQQQILPPLAGVIVENTFLGIAEMVDHLMPLLAPFKVLVLRMRWDSINIVPHITTPVLYLAGAKDQLVPHSHMLQLFKSTIKSKLLRVHIIKDGTHNETWAQGGPEYFEAMKNFIKLASAMNASSSGVVATGTDQTCINNNNNDTTEQKRSSTSSSSGGGAGGGGPDSGSTIPIMPSRLLGIARESIRDSTSSNAGDKKKEI